ncbi:MAG: M56 family metallopeptidase [Gemmatimonadaceae bacterium]|nr:M56 family metallopeptidase [Gemmatimonadaceae bacterium]
MIAAWMIYAAVVAALTVLAAHIAERTVRETTRPVRWLWLAAMILACLAPLATSPGRSTDGELTGASGQEDTFESIADGAELAGRRAPLLRSIPATVSVPASLAPTSLDRPLRVLWIAGSMAWLLVLAASARTVRRRAKEWVPTIVEGVPVLVSHSVGPALLGIFAPEIVLPAWVLELPHEQRTLAVEHERQHALVRDPLLLLAGALVLAAMPWNLALWYAWHRLRLAIEADCDQRVLRVRPEVHAYGSLILEVSERSLASAAPVLALAEPASHLARRIDLMTTRLQRPTRVRLALTFIASGLCVVLACRAPRPAAPAPTPSAATFRELNELLTSMSKAGSNPTADSLARLLEEIQFPQPGDTIADSTLRRAVESRYPAALRKGMGMRPLLWFVADARDSVLASATGHEGLTRTREGREVLEWASAERKFPDLVPPSMSPGGLLSWRQLVTGRDTVDVIWIRLSGEKK